MRIHSPVLAFAKVALIAIISVTVLNACQSATGRGDLQLSQNVQKGLKSYLNRTYPDIFAVSTDGKTYHYYYCETGGCVSPASSTHNVLQRCNIKSMTPCHLLVITNNVVWKKDSGETYTLEELFSDQGELPPLSSGTRPLCNVAYDQRRHQWSNTNTATPYIAELTRRGINTAYCAKLLALTN